MHYYRHPSLGILASEAGVPDDTWREITYEEYSAIFDANTALARRPLPPEPLPWWY